MKRLIFLLLFALPFIGFGQEKAVDNIDESIYLSVDKMPEFPGGEEAMFTFIQESIVYPSDFKSKKEKTVFIDFIVEKDGNVSNIKVIVGQDFFLDKEAVRVIASLPRFKPGSHQNSLKRIHYTVPIRFKKTL